MFFGVISDSHDNLPNIYKALDFFKQRSITCLIHCGDVCAPSVMKEIAEQFDGQVHLVFGNVDGDREKMIELASSLPNLTIHGETGSIELNGRKIAFVHYPEKANELARSNKYDLVFHGHDHKAWEKKVGRATVRNPGTLAGLFAKPTFAVVDPNTDTAELILIEKI